MILHVDPSALTETASPLREAIQVAHQVEVVRSEFIAHGVAVGSESVRLALEAFLDAWSAGLLGVAERAELLVAVLDTAAADYTDIEERTRRAAAAGADGGSA